MTSQAEEGAARWHWVTEGESPREGSQEELLTQLSSGRLPPFTLVWRPGWSQWLPAMQVADFAEALASYCVDPLPSPKLISPAAPRPRVPVSQFPNLRRMAREQLRRHRGAVRAALSERDLQAGARVTPLADLREEMMPLIGAPQGEPWSEEPLPNWATRDSNYPDQEIPTGEIPIAELQAAARAMTEPEPPVDLGLQPVSHESLTPAVAPVRPGRVHPASASPARHRPRQWTWLAGGLISLVLTAAWLFFSDRTEPAERVVDLATAPIPSRTTAAEPQRASAVEQDAGQEMDAQQSDDHTARKAVRAQPAPTVCRPTNELTQLDDWSISSVPPLILDEPSSHRVAVGYARSRTQARGLRLDTSTLTFEVVFGQTPPISASIQPYIYSVAPHEMAGAVSFEVERLDPDMAFGLALPTTPLLRLGMNNGGIEVGPLRRRGKRIWELPPRAIITLPSLAKRETEIVVTMRVGRRDSSVRSGLLSLQGQPRSELVSLSVPQGGRLGRPVIAATQDRTALAVVFRREGERDRLLLAGAKGSALPDTAQVLEGFDLDRRLRSPVIAALGDGGFALGWTEGKSWRRRVRLLKLSADLEPLAPPVSITVPDEQYRGATSAALHAPGGGNTLLLFYQLEREDGNGLWVTKVDCAVPRASDEN